MEGLKAYLAQNWARCDAGFRAELTRAVGAERRRATLYTDETVGRVLEHIGRGGSLTSAAREPGMPRRQTLGRWMKKDPVFAREVLTAYDDRDWLEAQALLGPAGEGGPKGASARGRVLRRIGGLKRRPGWRYGAARAD